MKHQAIKVNESPERATLAEAIRLSAKATADERKAEERVERAEKMVGDVIAAHDAAKRALAQAQVIAGDRIAASLEDGVSTIGGGGGALRQARAKEADAADDVTAAEAALEKLRAALEVSKGAIQETAMNVKLAASEILRAELERMFAETEALHQELQSRRLVLREIKRHIPSDYNFTECDFETAKRNSPLVKKVERYLDHVPFPIEHVGGSVSTPVLSEWQCAIEALSLDASVSLPKRWIEEQR